MAEEELNFNSIWSNLSRISVKDHIEVKNIGGAKLSYLSWAWAWTVMMENYPEMEVSFRDPEYALDGSCTVYCSVTIGDCTREMWLPVMDNRNNSATNPSSREISDAKMRCLVKTFALLGLGLYIYAGEDIPQTGELPKPKSTAKASPPVKVAEAPKNKLSEEQEAKFTNIEDTLGVFLEDAITVEALKTFWEDNKIPLKEMETFDHPRFEKLLAKFKAKRQEISTH